MLPAVPMLAAVAVFDRRAIVSFTLCVSSLPPVTVLAVVVSVFDEHAWLQRLLLACLLALGQCDTRRVSRLVLAADMLAALAHFLMRVHYTACSSELLPQQLSPPDSLAAP